MCYCYCKDLFHSQSLTKTIFSKKVNAVGRRKFTVLVPKDSVFQNPWCCKTTTTRWHLSWVCFFVYLVQFQSPLLDWDRPPGQQDQQCVISHQARAWPTTYVTALLLPTARLLPTAHWGLSALSDLQHTLLCCASCQPTSARESSTHQGNWGWCLTWLTNIPHPQRPLIYFTCHVSRNQNRHNKLTERTHEEWC